MASDQSNKHFTFIAPFRYILSAEKLAIKCNFKFMFFYFLPKTKGMFT